ncbi:MAG: STAS/SEC14 domain-containing protein [Bacteroidetes bacterium]|nr:STAS/SEC14 domain-containing protein [Bacteroidota bacterium]
MKYSIRIDHELKIIRYQHSGLINAEDIEDAWSEFLKIQEFTQLKYKLLSDYRGGKFQIPVTHLSAIIDFMSKIKNIVKGKKQALIVDNPYSVAASMLFENRVYKEIGFDVKVFSTKTEALRWLIN